MLPNHSPSPAEVTTISNSSSSCGYDGLAEDCTATSWRRSRLLQARAANVEEAPTAPTALRSTSSSMAAPWLLCVTMRCCNASQSR